MDGIVERLNIVNGSKRFSPIGPNVHFYKLYPQTTPRYYHSLDLVNYIDLLSIIIVLCHTA